jgi:hypothetical protein
MQRWSPCLLGCRTTAEALIMKFSIKVYIRSPPSPTACLVPMGQWSCRRHVRQGNQPGEVVSRASIGHSWNSCRCAPSVVRGLEFATRVCADGDLVTLIPWFAHAHPHHLGYHTLGSLLRSRHVPFISLALQRGLARREQCRQMLLHRGGSRRVLSCSAASTGRTLERATRQRPGRSARPSAGATERTARSVGHPAAGVRQTRRLARGRPRASPSTVGRHTRRVGARPRPRAATVDLAPRPRPGTRAPGAPPAPRGERRHPGAPRG